MGRVAAFFPPAYRSRSSRSRPLWSALAAIALSASVVVGGGGGAAAAPAADDPAVDVVNAATALAPGVDLAEAIDRLYADGKRVELATQVAERYPLSYAGWSYDGRTDVMTVRVAGERPAGLTELVAGSGLTVVVEEAPFSVQRLVAASNDLLAYFDRLMVTGVSAKADPDGGGIAITAERMEPAQTAAAEWSRLTGIPVQFVDSSGVVLEVCTDRYNCGDPLI